MLQGKWHNHFSHLILLAFHLFSVTFKFSQSQPEEYVVEMIPLEGELSGFSGSCMLQDSERFMWFGSSRNGLCRYDGRSFRMIRHNPSDRNSLSIDSGITLFM